MPAAAPSAPDANAKKKGAQFRITWPRVSYVPTAPLSVPRKPLLEGRRILLVEDDADVVQLLESALGARGAEVTVVRTLPELLDAATQVLPLDQIARTLIDAAGPLRTGELR